MQAQHLLTGAAQVSACSLGLWPGQCPGETRTVNPECQLERWGAGLSPLQQKLRQPRLPRESQRSKRNAQSGV